MSRFVAWTVSVRGRITVAVTVSFALVMVFGTWFLLNRAEAAWIDDLEAQDLAELEMIAQDIMAMEALDAMLAPELILPVGEGGTSYFLVDEAGVVVGETPPGVFGGAVIIDGPFAVDGGPVPPVFGEITGEIELRDDITTVTLPVELASGTLTLTAASPLEPVRAGVSALRGILLVLVPVLVGGIGITAWFVTGRAFRPVESISAQVDRITDDRLEERVPVPASRDEVADLAVTMNKMLDRLSASRQRQREFVSDASHELRNPIAAIKAKLEVALAHPESIDWNETATAVLEEQQRLEFLVDELLQLARLDEQAAAGREEVDLDDIVFAEAKRVAGTEMDLDGVNPTRVTGNPRQLTFAVRNLLDNAVRHAEAKVAVALVVEGEQAVLSVDDDGTGIPKGQRRTVFERFTRLDEARDRGRGGAGLGLALVAAVAAAHGGDVSVVDSPLGGARFVLSLPVESYAPNVRSDS
ncbi:MAG: HAMP domain-containing sensor histidine kinase [Acidimicrobiia bacterium]|nr:HAMP domain-containing sensor histidine kinase [Acidimicrobiia bacterium]